MLTGSYIKPSKEECLSFCNEVCIETPHGECIPSCEWFSFDHNQKVCLHFNSCSEIDETFTEYISGQKDCYQEPLCKFSIIKVVFTTYSYQVLGQLLRRLLYILTRYVCLFYH